jgi:hypothetical protein
LGALVRIDSRIHRRYGELMELERQALGPLADERRTELLKQLEVIEKTKQCIGRACSSFAVR